MVHAGDMRTALAALTSVVLVSATPRDAPALYGPWDEPDLSTIVGTWRGKVSWHGVPHFRGCATGTTGDVTLRVVRERSYYRIDLETVEPGLGVVRVVPFRTMLHGLFDDGDVRWSLPSSMPPTAPPSSASPATCCAAISADRVAVRPDGRVEYRFRRPDPTDRTSWVTDGPALCRRLATLIPPRRSHTVRFSARVRPTFGAPLRSNRRRRESACAQYLVSPGWSRTTYTGAVPSITTRCTTYPSRRT